MEKRGPALPVPYYLPPPFISNRKLRPPLRSLAALLDAKDFCNPSPTPDAGCQLSRVPSFTKRQLGRQTSSQKQIASALLVATSCQRRQRQKISPSARALVQPSASACSGISLMCRQPWTGQPCRPSTSTTGARPQTSISITRSTKEHRRR